MEENGMFMDPSDANLREQMIFNRQYSSDYYRYGGICHFEHLTYETARELLERGFISPEDRQNEAPRAEDFIRFMAEHEPERWFLHGYAVSPAREDVRISIEGIGSIGSLSDHDMVDFLRTFSSADSLFAEDGRPVFCWYD